MDQTLFLWALPLLALPWLLRLIRPQKPQRLFFSQMYLLREVLLKVQLKKKPNPLWLNLIRLLVLLALIFCCVGIYWPTQPLNSQAAQILLLDDSFYSQGDGDGSIFEAQKKAAEKLFMHMQAQQSVALLGTSGRETPWLNRQAAASILENWKASYRGENWLNVGLHINRLLRQSPSTSLELHLLGDGNSEDAMQAMAVLQRFSDKISIHAPVLSMDRPRDNHSLQVETWTTEQKLLVSGRIIPPLDHSSSLRLTHKNGRTEELKFTGDFRWELPLATTGLLEWTEQDGFVLDQQVPITGEFHRHRRLFFLKHREAEQRLQDPDYYLEKALQQVCRSEQWEMNVLFPADWNNSLGESGDIVFLQDPPYLSQGEAQGLERFWRKGGQIFLFCGPNTPLEIFDNCPWFPARLLSVMKSAHHIQWPKTWEVSCPLFQKLDIKGGWLFQQLQENAQVMARRDDGSPVWIKGRPSEFGGCVNLLSSPFHLSWSTATLQADFPTVLGLMLQKTDFSEFQRVVEAGSDIPKGVVASRAILGKSNSQEMAPGFVEFTLADGAIFPVLVQFSPDRFKERTPMPVAMHPELQKGPSGQKERMDLVLGLLLLFLFLIEVLFLLVNKKRLSLQV